MVRFFLVYFFLILPIFSQIIRGRVVDLQGKPIVNVSIFIPEYKIGTISNNDGYYRLKLPYGSFKIHFQHIGYDSYVISLNVNKDTVIIKNVVLSEKPIILSALEVLPQDNFANEIIKNILKYKKKYHSFLDEFNYLAYNKVVTYGISPKESFIGGILENFSRCYVKRPDQFKEIILAKRQTSNFSEANNVFTMGSFIDIFNEVIPIDDIHIQSPLSKNCFSYYEYFFEDSISYEGNIIYLIKFQPKNIKLMLFKGEIKVLADNYAVLECNLYGDKHIKTSIKNEITIKEKFKQYNDSIFVPFLLDMTYNIDMPFVKEIADTKIVMKQICLINNLRKGTGKDVFDNYIIYQELLPEDKQDSLWRNSQYLILTEEEKKAYETINKSLKEAPIIGKLMVNFGKYFPYLTKIPITSFNDFYHRNKVEGNYFGIGIDTKKYFNIMRLVFVAGRGTFSKRSAYFSKVYLTPFGDKFYTGGSIFDTLSFKERYIDYSKFDITTECIFNKRDYADYYYSKGNSLILGYKNKFIDFNVSIVKRKDMSIKKILKGFKNSNITDGRNRFIKFTFQFDSKKYIDLGFYTIEDITQDYLSLKFDYYYSSKNRLDSDWNYRFFYFNVEKLTRIASIGSLYLSFNTGKNYGTIIEQNKFYIPAQLSSFYSGINRFYGLKNNSIYGDDFYSIFFEYNFYNLLFNYFKIPYLENNKYSLTLFSKIGETNISFTNDKKSIKEFGFSINNIWLFFRLNFFWTSINNDNYKFNFSFTLNRDF